MKGWRTMLFNFVMTFAGCFVGAVADDPNLAGGGVAAAAIGAANMGLRKVTTTPLGASS